MDNIGNKKSFSNKNNNYTSINKIDNSSVSNDNIILISVAVGLFIISIILIILSYYLGSTYYYTTTTSPTFPGEKETIVKHWPQYALILFWVGIFLLISSVFLFMLLGPKMGCENMDFLFLLMLLNN